jgi:hypothetical protein
MWLRFAHPLAHVPTVSLDRSEIASAVPAYLKELGQDHPSSQMVFLGSSLVVAPLMQAEANYSKKNIEWFFNRRSSYFEHLINKSATGDVKVYSLAVGGEMASDAYWILKNVLLKEKYAPREIIYGIAPRDVQDNLLPAISASETFQTLGSISDLPQLFNVYGMSWEQKLNASLDRVWALWRYHSDIKTYLKLRAKKMIAHLLPDQMEQHKYKPFAEEAIGTPQVLPGSALPHTSREKTIDEFYYLRELIELCTQNRIKLTVVNMPLSAQNMALIPPGFYKEYLDSVKNDCLKARVVFIDLNTDSWRKDSNYADTVHLNSDVSQDFVADIAAAVAQSEIPQ